MITNIVFLNADSFYKNDAFILGYSPNTRGLIMELLDHYDEIVKYKYFMFLDNDKIVVSWYDYKDSGYYDILIQNLKTIFKLQMLS